MNEKEIKYIDELSRKVIEKSTIESPSFNFTDAVMSQVQALPQSDVTVYKPLISKSVWFVIGFGFLTVVLYNLFLETENRGLNWIQFLDFSALSNLNFNVFSSLSISKTFTYAVMVFTLMLCVQIPLLKNHINKRLEV